MNLLLLLLLLLLYNIITTIIIIIIPLKTAPTKRNGTQWKRWR